MRLFRVVEVIALLLAAAFVAFTVQGAVIMACDAIRSTFGSAHAGAIMHGENRHTAVLKRDPKSLVWSFTGRFPLDLSEQVRNGGMDRLTVGDPETWPVMLSGKGEETRGFRMSSLPLAGVPAARVNVRAFLGAAPEDEPLTLDEQSEAVRYILAQGMKGRDLSGMPLRAALRLARGETIETEAVNVAADGETFEPFPGAGYRCYIGKDRSTGTGRALYLTDVPLALAGLDADALAAFDQEKPSTWPVGKGRNSFGLAFALRLAGNERATVALGVSLKVKREPVPVLSAGAVAVMALDAAKAWLKERGIPVPAGADPVGMVADLGADLGGLAGPEGTPAGVTVEAGAAGAGDPAPVPVTVAAPGASGADVAEGKAHRKGRATR